MRHAHTIHIAQLVFRQVTANIQIGSAIQYVPAVRPEEILA